MSVYTENLEHYQSLLENSIIKTYQNQLLSTQEKIVYFIHFLGTTNDTDIAKNFTELEQITSFLLDTLITYKENKHLSHFYKLLLEFQSFRTQFSLYSYDELYVNEIEDPDKEMDIDMFIDEFSTVCSSFENWTEDWNLRNELVILFEKDHRFSF